MKKNKSTLTKIFQQIYLSEKIQKIKNLTFHKKKF